MATLSHFLQLIRYKNLLMIIATMLVIRYGLIEPMLTQDYASLPAALELQLPFGYFLCLVAATVLLSASGYIINDYFDVNIDMLNKPDKVIIGKYIKRRKALFFHWTFSIIGVIFGAIASVKIGFSQFTMIFVFISGLLWFYSTTFSKDPIIGNVIIAFLVALVPLITAVYELLPLNFMYKQILLSTFVSFEAMLFWSFGYAVFAFLLTLIREMIKDLEDLEGDKTYGRNTIPIAFGIRIAKIVVVAVSIVTLGVMLFVMVSYLQSASAQWYMLIGIIAPFLLTIILSITAKSSLQYARISAILKYIMLGGLLFLVAKNILF